MNRASILVFFSAAFVSGCGRVDQAIVDLSATIFSVFLLVVVFKFAFPWLSGTQAFRKFSEYLKSTTRYLVYPLYAIAVGLVAGGFLMGGKHQILIFVGMAVGVIAHFLQRHAKSGCNDSRKMSLEVVAFGSGVIAVLLLLWLQGGDLFRGLSPWPF